MRIFVFLSIVSLFGCKKSQIENNTLPPETQTGANTFGTVIRNQVWTTNGRYCYNQYGNCRENPLANYYNYDTPNNGALRLSADRVIYKGLTKTSSESFEISFYRNFTGTGIYHLKNVDTLFNVQYSDNMNNKFYQLLNERETFELNVIKFDTVAKIISGKFSGKLFNESELNDSINITNGRFDIKLK
jgi:hypothetical protein